MSLNLQYSVFIFTRQRHCHLSILTSGFSFVFQKKQRASSTPTIKRRIQTSLQVSVYIQKEVTTAY